MFQVKASPIRFPARVWVMAGAPMMVLLLVAALVMTIAGRVPADERTVEFDGTFTASQSAQLQSLLADPETATELVSTMNEAFGEVAQFGVSDVNDATEAQPDEGRPVKIQNVAATRPNLAYGANVSHVWITASYADMARGLIWTGVRVCIARRAPAWLCNHIGNTLSSWARGWGAAGNHGVWAEVYYAGWWRGGRW